MEAASTLPLTQPVTEGGVRLQARGQRSAGRRTCCRFVLLIEAVTGFAKTELDAGENVGIGSRSPAPNPDPDPDP